MSDANKGHLMGRACSIESLPPAVRKEVDSRLIESGFSGYTALANDLRKRGYYRVSKSGLHRYGQQIERRIQVARAREQLEAAGIDPKIADELTGQATLVVVIDRRNGRARLLNVAMTAAEILKRLK